jgi:spore coat protein U-like protein
MNRTALRFSLAIVAVLAANAAHAEVATATVGVSASVLPKCKISVTTHVAFTVSDLSAASDATGKLSVRCTKGTLYAIALNDGENVGRQMKNADGEFLDYELYSDSARSSAWPSTATLPTTGAGATGMPEEVEIFARVPAVADTAVYPAAGSYSDNVIATINY